MYAQWDKGNSHSYNEHTFIMNEKERNAMGGVELKMLEMKKENI